MVKKYRNSSVRTWQKIAFSRVLHESSVVDEQTLFKTASSEEYVNVSYASNQSVMDNQVIILHDIKINWGVVVHFIYVLEFLCDCFFSSCEPYVRSVFIRK